MQRHPVKTRTDLGPLELIEIAAETTVDLYAQGPAGGYHPFGNAWWTDDRCPVAFQYLSIDSLYPAQYFGAATGHPNPEQADALYAYMQRVYRSVMGSDFFSVLELGTGGGEITQAFHRAGRDYLAVEGTTAGVTKLLEDGIAPDRIRQYNLKFMPALDRRFDLVMCTEIAEHIEPFFASKVVENCIRHADAVWFSSADRNRPAHFHHINEQPIEVWDNLFAHMGFPFFVQLNGTAERASRLYLGQTVGRRRRAAAPSSFV